MVADLVADRERGCTQAIATALRLSAIGTLTPPRITATSAGSHEAAPALRIHVGRLQPLTALVEVPELLPEPDHGSGQWMPAASNYCDLTGTSFVDLRA